MEDKETKTEGSPIFIHEGGGDIPKDPFLTTSSQKIEPFEETSKEYDGLISKEDLYKDSGC